MFNRLLASLSLLAALLMVARAQPQLVPIALEDERDLQRLTATLTAPEAGDIQRANAAKRLALLNVLITSPALTAGLQDRVPEVRANCTKALGLIGNPTAVPALAAVTYDPDSTVRLEMVTALGRLQDPQAVKSLTRALTDADAKVRLAAVTALGRIDSPAAIISLYQAATGNDPALGTPALLALARRNIGNAVPLCVARMDQPDFNDITIVQALSEMHDPAATEALLKLLAHKTQAIRNQAALGLARSTDPQVVAQLIAYLKKRVTELTDYNQRQTELGPILCALRGSPAADDLLLDWMGNKELRVSSVAARAMATRYDVPIDRLMEQIRDYGWVAHWGAMEVMAERQPARVMAELVAQIKLGKTQAGTTDMSAQVTRGRPWRDSRFIDGLLGPPAPPIAFIVPEPKRGAWLNDPILTDHLIQRIKTKQSNGFYVGLTHDFRLTDAIVTALLPSEYVGTRDSGGLYLHDIGDPSAIPALLKATEDTEWQGRRGATAGLTGCADARHGESYAQLLAAVASGNPEVRKSAIAALGCCRDARAVPTILAGLKNDTVPEAREYAALALGLIGDTRAVAPLCAALNDNVEWARSAAAWALGEIGDPRAVPALQGALQMDKNARYQVRLARALYRLGEHDAAATLADLMGNNDDMTRELAFRALLECDDPRITGSLLARLAANTDRAIITALGRQHSEQAVHPLTQILREESSPALRAAAARALGDICLSRAADTLYRAATDDPMPEVRAAAALALADLRDPRAEELLERTMNEYEPERNAAIRALWALNTPRATTLLVEALTDDDPLGRALAGHGLWLRRDTRGATALRDLVATVTEPVALQVAIKYAADLHDPTLAPALIIYATATPDQATIFVAVEAVTTLGACGGPDATKALTVLLTSPASRLREAAARALTGSRDADARAALQARLAVEEASRVKDAITLALGKK